MKLAAPAALLALLALPAVALAQDESPATDPLIKPGAVGEGVPAFIVRPGYSVSLAAKDLEEARFLIFGDDGALYVSMPGQGKIQTLRDADGDGVYESRVDFAVGQSNAHSMDFHDGWLYWTSSQQGYCRRARDSDGDGKADAVEDVITQGIPKGGGHPFRGVLVTPEHIYITVSDPGNMTADLDSDRKKVYRFKHDGTGREEFAGGLRNTEKLQHRVGKDGTETEEIWGADHGSDWFGKDYGDREGDQPITNLNPPDELNKIVEGGFYGHPYLMHNRVPRPEFADRKDLHELAAKTIPAAWPYEPHSACNGFTFANAKAGEHFGPDHVGDLFQAQHGSWNSTEPQGYAVTRVFFDPMSGMPYGEWKIVDTFPEGNRRPLARPVDCAIAPDGTILFSCNTTRRIYRISKAG